MNSLETFNKIHKEVLYLRHAYDVLYWDMETSASEGAKEKVSDSLTYFSTEMFKKTTSDEYYEALKDLEKPENFSKLDDVMQFEVKTELKHLEKNRRIPADFYEQFVRTINNSAVIWPKAKQTNDWKLYEKPLQETIEAIKKEKAYTDPDKKVYDALIDDFEEGMTQETIDRVFTELRQELVPMVDKIVAAPQPDHSLFTMKIPAYEQKALCDYLLKYMGIDFNRFSDGTSEHPFTMAMSIDDVRITNHYYENEVISAIFSAIHEGGHALFEQNMDKKYQGTDGAYVDYMGLHESQSRFYENILGRNENFWKPIWKDVCEIVPEFKQITLDQFVREINHVSNSLIRTEADEVTYCLHIILRYEMEREIFINGAKTEDLPEMWNKKMQDYLHIAPSTDAEGILQDMHWSDGSFGYFPSYLLGSIYDGMFLEAMEKDLGPVDKVLAEGNLLRITDWLKTNIHQYGATRISSEVLDKVCGQPLSAKPLIKYFKEKYSKIYGLDL